MVMCDGCDAGFFIMCLLVFFEASCLIVERDWTRAQLCGAVAIQAA
jgi:hypothetical protein